MGQIEAIKNGTDANRSMDSANRLGLVERRINNLENYNHNLSNQMISLLSSINKNIMSLTDWIKDRGTQEEEEGKDREKARPKEDSAKVNIYTSQD